MISRRLRERLTFLAELDPVNERASGIDFMFLSCNAAARSLLSGIVDLGFLDRLDWKLAWILRRVGALDATVPCFTVAVRSEPENIGRYKKAWARLDCGIISPAGPATLTWTFILDASYNGILLEDLWDKRRLLAEIDGYALYQAPDMLGFSRS
jgi:hypothetical protein